MNVSNVTQNTAANASTATAAATTPTSSTSSSGSTSSSSTTAVNPNSVLNQADFLQLLVAQIQYQDPMNPQSDTEMASQMAQFSTLQQTTQSTSSLSMMQANSLIGSAVTVSIDSQHSASGTVTGVVMSNGAPQITINGTNYGLSQITSVTPPASTTSNVTPTSSTSSDTGSTTSSTDTTGSGSSSTGNGTNSN